jgi:hypothetical protein
LKIGYISKSNNGLDRKRSKLFLEFHDFRIVDRIPFISILRNRPTHFFIDDNISFIELTLIFILLKFNCIGTIVLRSIEMYAIDAKSLSSEILYIFGKDSKLSSTKKIFGKIWSARLYTKVYLFHLLLISKGTVLILPSDLRKQYFKSSIFFERIVVLRNIPLKEDFIIKVPKLSDFFNSTILNVIDSNQFYLLGGNVNSATELFYFAEYLKKQKKVMLIAGNNHKLAMECESRFKDHVHYIGLLDYSVLMYIISKSLGGVVLYNNSTINQRLSASSKLFEYMYFGKPVFVSDNLGVINELRKENYSYSVISNDVIRLVSNYYNGEFRRERYTFEFELSSNVGVKTFFI